MDPLTTTTVIADEPLQHVPGTTSKLRLMCSYGGHIFPTPHEKSLRYLGGETRMVVVDRRSSLASIVSRLSSSLLNGRRNFSLKYQLPNEELDSLVSLSSDEDLENLIEEYDRLVATASSSSHAFRLRVFIFFSKPETAASMGSLLDDAKSETWFVDALNGVSLLPRGLSDSAAVVDQLLDLDSVSVENHNEKQTNAIDAHEVFAGMSDSYLVENNSSPSFGSSSSSPSMSNLPLIRVRAEECVKPGINETVVSKSCVAAARYSDAPVHNVEFVCKVKDVDQFQAVSENERSNRSNAQVGLRKPPLPMYLSTQPVQQQNKNGLQYNFHSPGSVASKTSATSASSDQVQIAVKETRTPTSPLDRPKQVTGTSCSYQMMQHHETTYLVPSQHDNDGYSQQQRYYNPSLQSETETRGEQMPLSAQSQSNEHHDPDSRNQRMHHLQHQQQHFIHPTMLQSYETTSVQGQISEQPLQIFQQRQQHQFVPTEQQPSQEQVIQGGAQYTHQASIGQAPMPSYYMYTTQPPHPQIHHQPMYMLPVAQAPPYHTQLNTTTILTAPATQTQMETTSSTVLMSQNHNLIQHPSSQQYVNYSQFLHPAQTMAAPVTHERGYASRDHPHVYYTDQPPHSNVVPQYHTMNSFNHAHGVLPSQLPPADPHP